MDAEDAQMMAESERDAANMAKMEAETAKEMAEDNLLEAQSDLIKANADLAQARIDLVTARADAKKYKEMYEEAKAMLDEGAGPGVGPVAAMHEAARMAAMAIDAASFETPTYGSSVSLGCSSAEIETTDGSRSTTQDAQCDTASDSLVTVASVTRDGSNLMFMVTEGTGEDTDTKFDTAKHSPASVTAPSGWMAVALTNDMGGGRTERAVVYTNIEASESKAFTTVYRTELGNLGYMVVMGDNADIGLEPKTPLTAARITETAANLGPSYRGTYDGAAGTYDCTTGTGCTFTRTEQDDGSFTAVLTA